MSANNVKPISKKQLDQVVEHQKKVPMLKVQQTKPIKLKDQFGRGGLEFNLREVFGFLPDIIVISKVEGRNNVIVVSAVVPDRVLLQEEKDAKKRKKDKTVDKGPSKAN